MNIYQQIFYGLLFFGFLLILEDKFKKEGIFIMLFSFFALIILELSIKKKNKLSYNGNLVLNLNNNVESFITGKSDGTTLDNCDTDKTWIIDYDKSEALRKICPLYKNCEKRGNDVFCDGKKINNFQEKILECTQNYDLLNFVQNQWRNYCSNNKDHCLCLDLKNNDQKKNYVDNLKKWVDNLTTGQLQSWKEYLIDKLDLKFKKRTYLETKAHEHKNIQELIFHLKNLDNKVYLIVKENIGIDEDSIKSIYNKLIKTRSISMEKNEDQSSDNMIRVNLTLQILESILENYEQLVFDKNERFLPENKCKEIVSPVSKTLVKDDLLSITELDGECPKNHYLKGIRFEKDMNRNKPQLKKISSCCVTKNESECKTVNGNISDKLQRYNILDISQLSGKCPDNHYLKSINFKKEVTEIKNNDVVSIIANNEKYLHFNPMIYNKEYEKVCDKKKKWIVDRQTHKRCYTISGSKYCYDWKHPHWKQIEKLDCNNVFQGEYSTADSGKVYTKNKRYFETYINDRLQKSNKEPLNSEKLIIEIKPNNKIAFKTTENYYLSADPNSRDSEVKKPSQITIKSENKFMSSQDNGNINWNSDQDGEKEKFTFVNINHKDIAIKNKDNRFLTITKDKLVETKDIYVGNSYTNTKNITLYKPGYVPNLIPINPEYRRYGDRFEIKVEQNKLIVKRTDANIGWGQPLKIRLYLYEYNASFSSSTINQNQIFNIYSYNDKTYLIHKNLKLTRRENSAKFLPSALITNKGWLSNYYYYNQSNRLPDITTLKNRNSNLERVDNELYFRNNSSWKLRTNYNFASHHITYYKAETTGLYNFKLVSDDGSKLLIDGETIINNDGLHGMVSKFGYKNLSANKIYKMEVIFFQKYGGSGLICQYKLPNTYFYKKFMGDLIPNNSQFLEIVDLEPPANNTPIITAHSDVIGEKQLFELVKEEPLNEDIYSIKAYNGKYLKLNTDNTITFNSNLVADQEKFRIIKKTEIRQINQCCRAIKNEQCQVVYGPYTDGLDKDNILSLNKLDGQCPKNTYLKGLEIEQSSDNKELRYKMNCCRTDIPDNKNATWEQIINKTAPEYVPEPIESEIDELIRKDLKQKFCHTHTYIPDDKSDIVHHNKTTVDGCPINTDFNPDLTKNQDDEINNLEVFIESKNHYLNENMFLSKGQKLLFYLILLKIKNIKHEIDYKNIYKFLDSESNSNKNINLFNI